MNELHASRADRWLKLSLATLVVLNLALLATVWWPQLKRPPAKERRGMGGREREVAQQFLEDTLSLSPQQRERAAELRSAHFQKADALRKEINARRREMMEEVLAVAPDREKVGRLAAQLGEKQASLEQLTFAHFLELFNLCQPDQKEKFRSLMGELMDRVGPRQAQDAPQPPERERRRGIEGPREQAKDESRPRPRSQVDDAQSETSRTGNQIERLRDRLTLSDAQVAKLRPVVEQFARQVDECRARAHDDPRARQQAEKDIKDRRDAAIKALLTPEQGALLEQLKREGRRQEPAAAAPRDE
jgi:periplasmic protein CpxP/Spy